MSDPNNQNVLRLGAGIGADHPECRSDEIFICYTDEGNYGGIGWTTKRRGDRVFDDDDEDVTIEADGKFFPVFAKREELERAGLL